MTKLDKIKLDIIMSLVEDVLSNVSGEEDYEENELIEELANLYNAYDNAFSEQLNKEETSISLEEVKKLIENNESLESIIYVDYNELINFEDIDALNDLAVNLITNGTYSFELLDIGYEPIGIIDNQIVFKVVASPYISD